jgi:N,N'-diacetyllegionaminate synthase
VSIACVVPARGGSKGIPRKNLRPVGGVSLVGRAVLCAREFLRSASLTGIVLVDTDSEEIAAEARRWGGDVPFLRAPEFAEDDVPTAASTLAALERLAREGTTVETIVLLQPTSPLRSADDVLACWRRYEATSRRSVLSVVSTGHPAQLALRMGEDGTIEWREPPVADGVRRQDCEPTFWPSGAVYVISAALLRQERTFLVPGLTQGVLLPRARSIDIDEPDDLAAAEAMLAAQPVRPLAIGARTVGPGHPCFVIAEAGVNHNGDVALARRLIDVAKGAGADAVKFQTFEPDRLVAAGTPKAAYQIATTGGEEGQLELLRRLQLPRAEFESLAAYAESRGILFLSTPFDEGSADFLHHLGVPALKVPSGEITNHPFLAHVARLGRPLLISTGMSTLAEVAEALAVVRASGDPEVALFHCVTDYPASPADCNLRAMATMARAFGVPVGWSDHTLGLEISLAAVAAGAVLLEKHFTLDRTMPGPDHAASLEPQELTALVERVRGIESALGDGLKRPMASEAANAALVRRSLHAARTIPAGHVLTAADLVALRPGTGVPPSIQSRLVGRPLRMTLREGEPLREEHVG